MGPWHGEISSNVTFAYCTKWCIGVVVLRGRPLTHVRNLSMKPKPFYRAFSFFFLHEKSQRGCIRVRKLGDVKADAHSQQWERRLQENGLAWGAESYVTSYCLFLHYDLFFMRSDGLSILKACSYIFLPNMCLCVASEVTLLEIPPCQTPMCGVAHSCSYVLLVKLKRHRSA